jgi:hypothetical protein
MAISATQFVILRSPVSSTGRRENLILLNLFKNKKPKKRRDPHGFEKRSLRMTPAESDEILTRKSTAQDDGILNSFLHSHDRTTLIVYHFCQ